MKIVVRILVFLSVVACGSSNSAEKKSSYGSPATSPSSSPSTSPQTGADDDMGGAPASMPAEIEADEKETPPTSKDKLEAWLTAGHYKKWKCEASWHTARSPSGHSDNRICSNAKLSSTEDSDEFPIGAASVKELFDSAKKLNSYAVFVKTMAGATGDKWYWYERIGSSVIANGQGDKGSAKSTCVGCHARAGKDGASGRDLVFTQVK